MEVGIKLIAENIRTQDTRHVNSCFFTMVAVNDERRSIPVPPLHPVSVDEIRRFEAAKRRQESRRALAEKVDGTKHGK